MKQLHITALVCTLCLMVFTGCVTGGRSDSSNNLSQTVARHDQQIQSIMSQMGQVETVIPGQAEMWAQLQSMRQELNQTHARLEDSQGGGSARLEERVNRLETLVRTMASQLAISTAPLDAPSAIPASTPAYGAQNQPVRPQYGSTGGVVVVNNPQNTDDSDGALGETANAAGDPTALYNSGIQAFDQKKYKEAVVAFKDFASQNPKHKLTSNAHFWQGESYFQMKDYARAALAYQEVIAKYTGSSKYQSAMLKQGISLYHANKKDAAKERLQELIKRYPNSPEASRAKGFIKENKLG